MTESSEATRRVFERMLVNLKGKLEPAVIDALRVLVEAGGLSDLDALEKALRPGKGPDDGAR